MRIVPIWTILQRSSATELQQAAQNYPSAVQIIVIIFGPATRRDEGARPTSLQGSWAKVHKGQAASFNDRIRNIVRP
jgi:hypothetical protein